MRHVKCVFRHGDKCSTFVSLSIIVFISFRSKGAWLCPPRRLKQTMLEASLNARPIYEVDLKMVEIKAG